MKKEALCLLLWIVMIATVKAKCVDFPVAKDDKGKLTGKIFDKKSFESLRYVNVILYHATDSSLYLGTITDKAGSFTIGDVPIGNYYLEANLLGYEKYVSKIFNVGIGNTQLNPIPLAISVKQIKEVNVYNDRPKVEYLLDRKIIHVSKDINSEAGNAVDVLEGVPSVDIDADGQIKVRGSASFTVLIDGKPTIQSGNDALSQIPSNMIKHIELITNPSVRYDSEGVGGIINVIMKRRSSSGTSGLLSGMIGYKDKYQGNGILSHKAGDVNIIAGARLSSLLSTMDSETDKISTQSAGPEYLRIKSDREKLKENYNFYGDLMWELDSMNVVSLSGEVGRTNYDLLLENQTGTSLMEIPKVLNQQSVDDIDRKYDYSNASVHYRHLFKQSGDELTTLFYWGQFTGDDDNQLYKLDQATMRNNDSFLNSKKDGTLSEYQMNVDYSASLSKITKFESGVQMKMIRKYKTQNFEDLGELWNERDELIFQDNSIETKYDILAGYSQFIMQFDKLNIQLGLRAEYFDREIEEETQNETYKLSEWNMLPSFNTSYHWKSNQLQLSYSRRLNRPRSGKLERLPSYDDFYTVRTGNPYLRPEKTNNVSFNFSKMIKRTQVAIESYYIMMDDKHYSRQRELPSGVVEYFYDNIDEGRFLGTELSVNTPLNAWLRINTSIDYYRGNLKGDVGFTNVDKTSDHIKVKMFSLLKLNSTTNVQLAGIYYGAADTPFGRKSDYYIVNMTAMKSMMKRRLTATIRVNNIFDSLKNKTSFIGDNFRTYNTSHYEPYIINFGLTYKFNNYKHSRKTRGDDSSELENEY
ncbi:TonB-dependent receptor [Puteibacter caeruleilacunae]|nr:TonB-dependent receptor [Puteibacter caeruleilacunae]